MTQIRPTLPAFTLIELVLYSVLVSMVLTSFLAASSAFIASGRRDLTRAAVVENQRYLDSKFDEVLRDVTATEVTPTSGTSASLEVNRTVGEHVMVDLNGTSLRLQRDTNGNDTIDVDDEVLLLTNSRVTVSDWSVEGFTVNAHPAIRLRATIQGGQSTVLVDKTVYLK